VISTASGDSIRLPSRTYTHTHTQRHAHAHTLSPGSSLRHSEHLIYLDGQPTSRSTNQPTNLHTYLHTSYIIEPADFAVARLPTMATATASPPIIPPRPSRSSEDKSSSPMIPPRPINRRVPRPISPNPDRFAPSPLNETGFLKSPGLQNGRNGYSQDPIPRSHSVELPSLGEEGKEYATLAAELDEENAAPEQTRTVADDLKLHAPRPSLPPSSAKQRVMTVTRTDSERAAAFGIGRPSSVEDSTAAVPSNRSLKKKASTASQLSTSDTHIDDEQGIPEIGLRVPMYKNAGDVQAPSPAITGPEGAKGKHHTRRTSARGNLPPGSYGLHGHGVAPQDKLEKAYYDKHPDLLKKEKVQHHYDRPNDFSMSRGDLDKIVRDTASRGSGLGMFGPCTRPTETQNNKANRPLAAVKNYTGTPSDQVGWQAMEESASRIASPHIESPELKPESIHVDEPNRRRSVMFSDTESLNEDEPERSYTAPILADDEVAKDPSPYANQPAVEPPVMELEETSRPSSRPASVYKEPTFELQHTPLEDVEEYEPLFKDDEKKTAELATTKAEKRKSNQPQRFPSADVWEDAPSSVFYTAEVSAPDLFDEQEKPGPTPQEGETPAQAFARHQEALAEKELHGQRETQKSVWSPPPTAAAAAPKALVRPPMHPRFPSRDVWEDAPDSLQLETTVSTPQQDEVPASPADTLKPEIPERPSIPERPKPKKQPSTDDKPAIPDRPKPQIPARPAKASPAPAATSEPADAAAATAPAPRAKPAVPARPMGSKIAALQAGFMSDLNRRLQLGPQAPVKKEEPAEEEEEKKVEEKAPLVDARKGRARGPARRAPAAAAAPAAEVVVTPPAEEKKVVFGFVGAVRLFEIDPDEGDVVVAGEVVKPVVEVKAEPEPEPEVEEEKVEEPAKVEVEPEPAKKEVKAEVVAEPEPEPEPAAAAEPVAPVVAEVGEKAKAEDVVS